MDVELTFVPDDRELNGVGPDTDEGHLFETSVVGWFRFRVGDHEILPAPPQQRGQPMSGPGGPSSWVADTPDARPGAPQPVIGFTCRIRDAIRRAAAGEPSSARLAFGWPDLHFAPSGDGLIAVRLGRDAPAAADLRGLENAIASLEQAVMSWIVRTAPEMQQHPRWSSWFGARQP